MKTYYRFYFATTQEILEFDTEMVSFKTAERKAWAWARDAKSTCEYLGIISR